MRRALAVAALALVVSATSSAAGPKVLLGITGNVDHFKQLTGQQSAVHQAFLGWGQGQGYGSPFKDLLTMFGPVPMFHLGTAARPPSKSEAITPAAIAAGRGDSYLFALNGAIGEFGKLVYVRPMAEMNNPINLYSYERKHDAAHSPPAYQSAFCRIFILLHGGTKAAGQRAAEGSRAACDHPGPRGQPLPEPPAGDLEPARRHRARREPGRALLPRRRLRGHDRQRHVLVRRPAAGRSRRTRRCTTPTRTSRTRCPSGACRESTIPSSSSGSATS